MTISSSYVLPSYFKLRDVTIVVEDESNMVRPLTIQVDDQVETCNIGEENLDLEDLYDTI